MKKRSLVWPMSGLTYQLATPLRSATATWARLRPMTMTMAPVMTGGISHSTHL